ncbi:hypothetical protein [Polynucleobacter sp. AP-Nino-20-G2]|uniref:hypothetical protein n=1 Tax=Polynucleobacter sp. AP-Nino-20-G2 TaxID=2576917 RepID=UPI001BFDBDCB|nr:hypothetical protein [Polynucleobacter sp. AP-Nino-20-G2]QWE16903.1 hypothetical protein FD960_01365 [Polynucleobacter sp. AP-Nino-20-G2]
MIIAWVLSLLMLLASLVNILERSVALELVALNTATDSGKKFIAAEKALLECEQHLENIAAINIACHIQSAGKNLWLISTKENPTIEILVSLDEKTKQVTRLNWRQEFK